MYTGCFLYDLTCLKCYKMTSFCPIFTIRSRIIPEVMWLQNNLILPKVCGSFHLHVTKSKMGLYVILAFLDLFVIIRRHILLHCERTTRDKNTYEPIFCRRNLGHSQKVHISQCRWKMRLSLLIIDQKS